MERKTITLSLAQRKPYSEPYTLVVPTIACSSIQKLYVARYLQKSKATAHARERKKGCVCSERPRTGGDQLELATCLVRVVKIEGLLTVSRQRCLRYILFGTRGWRNGGLLEVMISSYPPLSLSPSSLSGGFCILVSYTELAILRSYSSRLSHNLFRIYL